MTDERKGAIAYVHVPDGADSTDLDGTIIQRGTVGKFERIDGKWVLIELLPDESVEASLSRAFRDVREGRVYPIDTLWDDFDLTPPAAQTEGGDDA